MEVLRVLNGLSLRGLGGLEALQYGVLRVPRGAGVQGLEVVEVLQRELYTNRPWLGITQRGVGRWVL
jgi:hypothetical protein